MNNNGTRILLICVNYNNTMETCKFVNHVLKKDLSESIRIIVVDNSPQNEHSVNLDELQEEDGRILILTPGGNIGYFGGAAWGLDKYLLDNPLPDWIIVSNTDIVIAHDNFFKELTHNPVDEDCLVIAPSVISSYSHEDQNPLFWTRPSIWLMRFYGLVFRFNIIFYIYRAMSVIKRITHIKIKRILKLIHLMETGPLLKRKSQEIYAPHGSFLIFSSKYFTSGGSLKFDNFLFGEEIFVAETVRRIGAKIIYEPLYVIYHNEHVSTRLLSNNQIFNFMRQSYKKLYNEYFIDKTR